MKIDLTIDEIQVLLVALHRQEHEEELVAQNTYGTCSTQDKANAREVLNVLMSVRRKLRDTKAEHAAKAIHPKVNPR